MPKEENSRQQYVRPVIVKYLIRNQDQKKKKNNLLQRINLKNY